MSIEPAASAEPIAADAASGRLRALVVSDIHAVPDNNPTRNSWADMSNANNPIAKLPEFLRQSSVTADVVLCPGDLGHHAHPTATTWAWERLHDIGAAVGAEHVIATTGNHDADSRHLGKSFDPRDHLKNNLSPSFPGVAPAADYWAYSVKMVVQDRWRIVTLDSCFHHSAGTDEHEHGRVESSVLERLERDLNSTDAQAEVNVLLCHHHPTPHTELDPADRSTMKGGDRLLDLLDQDRHGRWLVVHGHKHFPWLRYAPGSSISPVVFSAGSASVLLYESLNTRVRNQVHAIVLDTAVSAAARLHLAGTFESWAWSSGVGWGRAPTDTGLPGRGGFGFRVDLNDLADHIAEEHARAGRRTLRHDDLVTSEPRLPYLAPIDLSALREILRRDYSIALRLYDDGSISDSTAP